VNPKNAPDRVTFKVGRNVLLFQKLEHILKYIVGNGSIAGYQSELQSRVEKRKGAVAKKTLGMVVGDFLDAPEPQAAPEGLRETHITIRHSYELDPAHKAQIEDLVKERNHLVHHFMTEVSFDVIDSCLEAEKSLDDQADRLRKAIAMLQNMAQTLSDLRKELVEGMIMDEFWHQPES
jgi:hypothetical protein